VLWHWFYTKIGEKKVTNKLITLRNLVFAAITIAIAIVLISLYSNSSLTENNAVAISQDALPNHLPSLTSDRTKTSSQSALKIDKFGDAVQRQFVSADNATIAFFTLDKEGVVPWHNHEAEQITHVLNGEMIFTVGSDMKQFHLKKGDILMIPSKVPHKALAIKDTFEIDIFSPIR
jgi:quercetin dioxygenase-like cupin family protein